MQDDGWPPEPIGARFDDDRIWVSLEDGRVIGVPLVWYPRLLRATPSQRTAVELGLMGFHWEKIDEDLSIEGMLAGRRDMTRSALTP